MQLFSRDNNVYKISNIILLFISLSALSCEYDNAEKVYWDSLGEIKFTEEILPVINMHCSIQGCHVNGAAIGNFSDYNQLKQRIDNGKFQKMVFELKLMPPVASRQLNKTDYLLLDRWLDSGATY